MSAWNCGLWASDDAGYRAWLAQHRHLAALERAADNELTRQLETGATIAAVELPMMAILLETLPF
jgi:hypothetical protein